MQLLTAGLQSTKMDARMWNAVAWRQSNMDYYFIRINSDEQFTVIWTQCFIYIWKRTQNSAVN